MADWIPSNTLFELVSFTSCNEKTHYNIYDVFFSQSSHQPVSVSIAAIFRVILLQGHKRTNVGSCVVVTP